MYDSSTIRILFLSADPSNAPKLFIDQELRDIKEKLRQANLRDNFVLESRTSARPGDISQAILDFKLLYIFLGMVLARVSFVLKMSKEKLSQ